MYYSDDIIEEVRSANNIVDVVGSYVRLQKKGANYWGLCPFHNEKTPSFSVHEGKQIYHCFGCNAGGNVISFMMNYENMTFGEAMKALAERAGIALPEVNDEEAKRRNSKRERLLECNKAAAKFFYFNLRSPHGEIGMRYLKGRGLSNETIHKFGLGFAGKNSGELISYLRKEGFEDREIVEAGLASHNERDGLSNPFWNRVMYPIQDQGGRVIGFGGRVMGDAKPKYLNSQETLIFDKKRNLYGLNFARTSRVGNFIMCEGDMDVIALHQAGFSQAMASLGTAFTVEQAQILKKYKPEVVYLAYDSDGAGVKAALRNIGILRDTGLNCKIINMRPQKDPDEFIKANGADEFQKRIDNAENSFFFEVRIAEEEAGDMKDPAVKTAFHKEIAKKLCVFTDEVERNNYLEAVCDKYHISFDAMKKLVINTAADVDREKVYQAPKSGINRRERIKDREKLPQRTLLTLISDNPEIYPQIKKYLSIEDFTDEIYAQIAKRMFDDLESGNMNPAAIVSMYTEAEEQRIVSEVFNSEIPNIDSPEDTAKAIKDVLIAVKNAGFEKFSSEIDMTDAASLNAVVTARLKRDSELSEIQKLNIRL